MIFCRPVFSNFAPLFIVFVISLFAGCSGDMDTAALMNSDTTRPVQQLYNTRMRLFDLNGLSGILVSPRIDQYQSPDLVKMPLGFHLFAYDSLGNDEAEMVADTGYYMQRYQKIRATGHVRITNRDGLTLFTNSLYWDQRRERITTEDSVRFVTDQDTLYGVGFESARDLSWWEIKQTTGRSWRNLETQ